MPLCRFNLVCADAVDVGSALVEGVDFFPVNIEAGDRELLVTEEQGEGQADISHANNTDLGLALLNFEFELVRRAICSGLMAHYFRGVTFCLRQFSCGSFCELDFSTHIRITRRIAVSRSNITATVRSHERA